MEYNIVIIGCGGTGGNYIQDLGRYIYANGLQERCRLLVVDGDVVEKKNIGRQPFLPSDIGRKKAEVMAEIMNEIFHLKCDFYPEYINEVEQLENFELTSTFTMLIGCVDNHACRKVMHEFFMKSPMCYYLDSANEEFIGEVVVGARICNREICPDRAYYFPEILSDTSPNRSEQSCLELSESNPQHYVTNRTAANLLLKCTIDIVEEKGWKGGIYYFDVREGKMDFKEKMVE